MSASYHGKPCVAYCEAGDLEVSTLTAEVDAAKRAVSEAAAELLTRLDASPRSPRHAIRRDIRLNGSAMLVFPDIKRWDVGAMVPSV